MKQQLTSSKTIQDPTVNAGLVTVSYHGTLDYCHSIEAKSCADFDDIEVGFIVTEDVIASV